MAVATPEFTNTPPTQRTTATGPTAGPLAANANNSTGSSGGTVKPGTRTPPGSTGTTTVAAAGDRPVPASGRTNNSARGVTPEAAQAGTSTPGYVSPKTQEGPGPSGGYIPTGNGGGEGGSSAPSIDTTADPYAAENAAAAATTKRIVNGVDLTEEKLDKIYEKFLVLADQKKEVSDADALMLAGADTADTHAVRLDFLQVTTGKGVKSVASIGLDISGQKFEAAASGNGPVDAAIKALKKIIMKQMTLKEFTIQAISKGSDDVGKVHMQVEYNGSLYYGFGANTDIVTASVEAYIDCINKFKND